MIYVFVAVVRIDNIKNEVIVSESNEGIKILYGALIFIQVK